MKYIALHLLIGTSLIYFYFVLHYWYFFLFVHIIIIF